MNGLKRRSTLPLLRRLLLVLACLAGWTDLAQAQNFAGSEVSLHGATFTYDSAGWNGYPVDYYYASGGGNPAVFSGTQFSGVATVSHGADGNAPDFNGFWTNGTYTDAHAETSISESLSLNGDSYSANTRVIDYSLDGNGQLVYSTSTTYGSSNNHFFTAQINPDGYGSITGYENGVVLAGTWYVNLVQSNSDTRTIDGVYYQGTTFVTLYSTDGNSPPQLLTSHQYNYTSSDSAHPGFSVSIYTDGTGSISGSVSGVVLNGGYYINNTQPLSDSRTIDGVYYQGTTFATTYSLSGDSPPQVLTSYQYSFSSSDSSHPGFTVSVSPDGSGSITGSVSGIVLGGSWYVNNTQSYSDSRTVNDVSYYGTTYTTFYSVSSDSPPQVLTGYQYNYSSSDIAHPGFSVTVYADRSGTITGSETGYVLNGSWMFNSRGYISSLSISPPPNPLFGRNYNFYSGTYTTVSQSDGSSVYTETVLYKSDDTQASYTVSASRSQSSPSSNWSNWQASLTGNDPSIGSLAGTFTDNGYNNGTGTWQGTSSARTSPSFAPSVIYNPGTAVNFVSGALDFNGNATDSYATADNTFHVTISGNLHDRDNNYYYEANASATDGYYSGSGTYNTSTGHFSVSGFDLRLSQKVGTNNTHTSGTTYWLNGVLRLSWKEGSDGDDGDGNTYSYDTYSNSVTGDSLSISSWYSPSTTSSGSSATLYFEGGYFYGQDIGSLNSYNSTPPPGISGTAPTPGGPEAFWLGASSYGRQMGSVFQKAESESLYYSSPLGWRLTLSGSGGSFTAHVYLPNSDGSQSFDFGFDGQPGVFTFTDKGGVLQLGFTVSSSEVIQVSSSGPPENFPPAIYVADAVGNYSFIGSALDLDDPSQVDYYYAYRTLDYNTPYWYLRGVNMLKIHNGNVVTLLGSNGYVSVGSYDPQTLLFQTDPSDTSNSPLPTPIYGTDPLHNGLPFVHTPPSGLPASAVINGQLWRFASVDSNGVVHYIGRYTGQTLTLTLNTTREGVGVWDVALTDPFGTNDVGEFHNYTFSMQNGTGVGSGTITGTTINPLNIARQSIAGDIDIFGNVLSLGALQDDPDTAGLTMSFADDLTTSSLTLALARPSSSWTWSHPGTLGSGTLLPAMKLDASHRLGIYSLADASAPAIMLDPAGISNFKADVSVQGTLRVKPRGDLGMGSFTNGPQP